MWVKRDGKTVYIDLDEVFLNFGYIDKNKLKKILAESKYNETIKLHPTANMIHDIQKAFSILDYRGRGLVKTRDLKVVLRSLGIEVTGKKLKKLTDRVTKTSEFSREQFEKILIEVIQDIDSDEQMIQSFQQFTSDEVLSMEDLKRIAEDLEMNIADEEIQEMIEIAETDGRGLVTQDMFISIARKIF